MLLHFAVVLIHAEVSSHGLASKNLALIVGLLFIHYLWSPCFNPASALRWHQI